MNFVLGEEALLVSPVDFEVSHLLSMEVKEKVFCAIFDSQSD